MLNTSPIPNYDCTNSKLVLYVKNVNMGILKQLEIINFISLSFVSIILIVYINEYYNICMQTFWCFIEMKKKQTLVLRTNNEKNSAYVFWNTNVWYIESEIQNF